MEFFCPDDECTFEGGGQYTVDIPQEACMDDYNIASIFCPYCNSPLLKVEVPVTETGIENSEESNCPA